MATPFEAARRCDSFTGLGSPGCSVPAPCRVWPAVSAGAWVLGSIARLPRGPSCPSFSLLSRCSPQFAHLSFHRGITVHSVPLAQGCAWEPLWLLLCRFKLSCPSRHQVSCPRRLWRSRECSERTCPSRSVSSAASLAAHLPDLPSQPAFLFSSLTLSPPMVTVSVPSPGVISPGAVFLGTPVLDRALFQPRHGPVSWVGRSEAPASLCVTLDGETLSAGLQFESRVSRGVRG